MTRLGDLSWVKIQRDTAASAHLDMIRGLAALAVMFSHARVLLIASQSPDMHLSLAARLLYLLSGYGHTAVVLFFPLSGSLVGGSVVQAIAENRWSWKKYLLARSVRLYIVLLPALLLTALLDKSGLVLSYSAVLNHDTAQAIITPAQISAHLGPGILAGNAAFLQTIFVPTYGSNTALWSLANEFWYYLIFPCLWLAVAGRLPVLHRVLYGSLGVLLLLFVGRSIAAYFPFWLMGVLAMLHLPRLQKMAQSFGWAWPVSLLGFTVILALIGLGKIAFGEAANLAAALFFFPVLVLILRRQTVLNKRYERVAAALAGCSFTLYATHLPLLVFLRARFTLTQPWSPRPIGWLMVGLACAAIWAFAFVLARLTEAQTDRMKNWLAALFKPKPAAHPAALAEK